MSTTFGSLGLDSLTDQQKLTVVEELLDDLLENATTSVFLTEERRTELLRRQADAHANPEDRVSWETVRDAALQELEHP